MTLPAEMTLLIMSTTGVPLYSARGLTQNVTPVQEAKPPPLRTINGEARFLGGSQMRKYDSTIQFNDQHPPPFGELWPGDEIVVDCVFEFSYASHTGSPERTAVEDSTREVGDFTLYRPRMTFIVVDWDKGFQEYPNDYNARLLLTEK